MPGYLSQGTTDFSNVSLYGSNGLFASNASISNVTASRVSSNVSILANAVWASNVSVGSTLSVGGSIIASGVTLDLRTNAVRLSYATEANVSGLTTGMLGIVFQASGISLIYSSGKSVYVVGQSSQSAAGA